MYATTAILQSSSIEAFVSKTSSLPSNDCNIQCICL
jgi:hypothetical protein